MEIWSNLALAVVATVLTVPTSDNEEMLDAARAGDLASVKRLLASKPALVNTVDEGIGGSYTPLHYAAEAGHREVVEVLLAAGASVTAKAGFGMKPLHLAVWQGHRDIAEL